MIQALVFDLDDTLYPERTYVASGYRAVARHIAERNGCSYRDLFRTMMSDFAAYGRERVLPSILGRFQLEKMALSELVEVYRTHAPHIRLFPGYGGLLQRLRSSYKLGIITDGLPEVQRRKIKALRLEEKVDQVTYTWEYGADKQKPHPLPFKLMMELLGSMPMNTLYIGDNPEKDCKGAHGVGMKYAQVKTSPAQGERSEPACADEPEFVLDSVHQLPLILRSDGGK